MHPSLLIDYIKQNGFDALTSNLSVSVKPHGKYPNLLLLKYNQIESDFHNPVVRLCRGIIIDKNDLSVVCYTYPKFANHGEGYADKIDWASSRVMEKLDGSLMQLYYYDGAWQVASSGMADAAGQAGDFGFSFADLFWRVWNEMGYKLPTETNKCFSFELCSKYNKVVVQHKEDRIVLHGVRDLNTFQECNSMIDGPLNGWQVVKTFPMSSIDEVVNATKSIKGTEAEGFVVVDSQYRRNKIKAENYVALAHLKDSAGKSLRQLVELVRKNEGEEFLQYFPEFSDNYYEIKGKYDSLLTQVEGFYETIKDIVDRKQFAMKAKDHKQSGLLFSMYLDKIKTFKQGMVNVNIKTLEEWLGVKTVE